MHEQACDCTADRLSKDLRCAGRSPHRDADSAAAIGRAGRRPRRAVHGRSRQFKPMSKLDPFRSLESGESGRCRPPVLLPSRTSLLRHATDDAHWPEAFRDPALGNHVRSDRSACRVAVIWRTAAAVVVKPVERYRPALTDTSENGQTHREDLALEDPIGVLPYRRAFPIERRVEVRALGCECLPAPEPAHACGIRDDAVDGE